MGENPRKQKSFETLTDIYKKFKQLSKIETNTDETKLEPVLKYVTDMCEELQDDNTCVELVLKLRTIKGSLLYDEARALLSKQKIFIAVEKLKNALQLVKPYKLNPKMTYLYFRILNQLAYFLAQNNELDESLKLLEGAESLYEHLENKSEILIFDTDDLFQEICPRKKRNVMKFEKLITNNFHLQGWIYNRQHRTNKFTIYFHMGLRRQLETQDSSALVWIFKCARLASYFFGSFKFSEARYLLAASYYVLREYELDLLKRRSDAHFSAEWANLQKYYADLGKYWVKYGLFLFEASRRALPNNLIDTAINEILIKSFKDIPPRKSFQSIQKMYKEKLQTIEEKPEISSNQELPQNNEPLIQVELANNQIETDNNEINAESVTNEKEDAVLNKDVAEITESIINLIDDQMKDEDNNRKYCVAKYINMWDNLTSTSSPPKTEQNTNSISTENLDIPKEENKEQDVSSKEKSEYQFIFPTLMLNDIESKVTNDLITTLEEARSLFLFTQEWLKRSKAFYSIQDFSLDYVNLILDLNELYRFLSLYETSLDMQYDVQKRRVDLLEKLTQTLKEYRPQFYITLNIELVNELTQAQIELILLNLRRLTTAQSPVPQKEETYRKMDALLEIRKRLSRKETFVTYSATTLDATISEPELG